GEVQPQVLTPLAKLALAFIVVLLAAGLFWYGLSADASQRLWRGIAGRPGGPVAFPVVLQPGLAALAAPPPRAVGAPPGRLPYQWSLLTERPERTGRLREGLSATARIILLGIGMDLIYQLTVLKSFYPGEAAIIAILLAFVPYLLLRGPFARLARWWGSRS